LDYFILFRNLPDEEIEGVATLIISASHPGWIGSTYLSRWQSCRDNLSSLKREPSAHLGPSEEACCSHPRSQSMPQEQDRGFPFSEMRNINKKAFFFTIYADM